MHNNVWWFYGDCLMRIQYTWYISSGRSYYDLNGSCFRDLVDLYNLCRKIPLNFLEMKLLEFLNPHKLASKSNRLLRYYKFVKNLFFSVFICFFYSSQSMDEIDDCDRHSFDYWYYTPIDIATNLWPNVNGYG